MEGKTTIVTGAGRGIGRAIAVTLDVSREEQVNEGVECVLSKFGKIDIPCSNTGIFMTKPVAV